MAGQMVVSMAVYLAVYLGLHLVAKMDLLKAENSADNLVMTTAVSMVAQMAEM